MRERLLQPLLGALLLAVPLAAAATVATQSSPADARVLVNFVVTVAIVVAMQTFIGNSGIVSFGHVAFLGIGAYTTALLTIPPALKESTLPELPRVLAESDVSYLPSILAAGLVAGVAALAIGLVMARMDASAVPLATIGILVASFVVFDNWDVFTRGAQGLFGVPQRTTSWGAVAIATIVLAVARLFRASRTGLRLRASATDPLAAEALGVDVVRARLIGWTLSGVLMGVCGGVWASYNLAFGSRDFFFDQTFALLAVLVVGGMFTVTGAVAGAVVVTVATEVVRRSSDAAGLTPIVVSLLILLILYVRRAGLFGSWELDERLRTASRRRSAAKAARGARS